MLTVGVNALVCRLPGVNRRVLNTVFSVSSYILVLRLRYIWVPILQSRGEPERAGEARRADSASNKNKVSKKCPKNRHAFEGARPTRTES